jgi:hypothetical protein
MAEPSIAQKPLDEFNVRRSHDATRAANQVRRACKILRHRQFWSSGVQGVTAAAASVAMTAAMKKGPGISRPFALSRSTGA